MEDHGIGTTIVTQIGLVVRDIEQKIDAYCEIFSVTRPKVIITEDFQISHTKYKGEPSKARAKLAFFQMGQVSIELIEPIGEPSTWNDFLLEKGEGIHHIAFQVKDTEKIVALLDKKGIPLIQQGDYTGGMYSYMDATLKLGLVLELLENF